MSEILCPVCNRPNPDTLQTCQFCGANLPHSPSAPASTIRAGETPVPKKTSEFEKVKLPDKGPIPAGQTPVPQDTGELEQALPSWLRSLRGEDSSSADESPADASASVGPSSQPDSAQPADASGESLDWLARLGQQEEEEEKIPEWMASLRVPEEETPAPQIVQQLPGPEPEEVNPADWFTRLASETESGTQEAPLSGETGAPAESLPAWLEGLKAAEAEMPDWLTPLREDAEPTTSSQTTFEPDWSGNLPEEPLAAQSEPEPAVPALETPDWLKNLGGESFEQPVEEPETSSAEETPDWLSALSAEAGARIEAAEAVFRDGAPPEESTPSEIPDWLRKIHSGEELSISDESEEAEPAPVDTLSETTPHWLADIKKSAPLPSAVPALIEDDNEQPPESSKPADSFSLETPDWLTRLGSESSVEPSAPPETGEAENIEIAELPSWVQAMKPVEAVVSEVKPAVVEEMGVSETSGPLAGLRGVLPGGMTVFPSRKPPAYSIKLQVSENQYRDAEHLEQIILGEGQPREIKPTAIPSSLVWRWIISFVLLCAVALPLVFGTQTAPDLMLFPSEWERTHLLLDTLPVNAPVLAVFDYDPALSSELQAAAAPVMDRVLSRGVRLTLLSTSPTGPSLAEQFLQSTQAAHLQTGAQYVNLGYLPGGPSGIYYFATEPQAAMLRALDGSDAWSSPALQGVSQLTDFGALFIITDNADTARAWIEQTQSTIGNTPILMIVSAQAEPMVRPYFDSGQVDGMVTGLTGGKTYEQTYGTSGLGRRYWDAFGTGILTAILFMLVGGVMNALLSQSNRTRGKN